jgi:pimeloyl-ACP methyl ester carboxylesterase
MKNVITKSIGIGLNTLAYVAPRKAATLGFELFCRPFRTAIKKKQKAFFNTAELQTFDFNGTAIQTYRWGKSDKKILLLHGWQSHTYRWKLYIEALSKDYTVYALDAPGHGLSSGSQLNVPLYSSVIEEQIKRIGSIDTIVTHSLGGFATFYAFHRNPNLPVNKIVALASPGEAQEFFNFYVKMLKLSSRCERLIVNKFEELFQQKPEYFSAPAFAAGLTVPGLIIHDEHDDETSFHHAERIHRAWKNSRLIKTRGFGHNLRSIEVVKEVVQFVNEPLPEHYASEKIFDSKNQ